MVVTPEEREQWKTMAGRITWILEHTRPSPSSKWSGKALSKAAELSESQVNQLKTGKVRNGSSATIAAIARAARVDLGWLSTGDGLPYLTTSETTVEPETGLLWKFLQGWEAAVDECRRLFPGIPLQIFQMLSGFNGAFVQTPVKVDWLALRAHQLMREISERDPKALAEMALESVNAEINARIEYERKEHERADAQRNTQLELKKRS